MSYDLNLYVDLPGRDLEEVVGANFDGSEELEPGPVDVGAIAEGLRGILSPGSQVEARADTLRASDPGAGLTVDLDSEGGQVNLTHEADPGSWELAMQILRLVEAHSGFFGYDPQRGVRVTGATGGPDPRP